jgi:PAS domain S-box-containing protein
LFGTRRTPATQRAREFRLFDCVEERRGEDLVEAHRQFVSQTQDSPPAGAARDGAAFALTNATGTILCVSPAFERLTGYARHEIVGRKLHIAPESETAGGARAGIVRDFRKDGTAYQVSATTTPVRDASGATLQCVALDAGGPSHAAETDWCLSQTQQALARVTSGIAHHLNNRLTPIVGQAQLLRFDGGLPQPSLRKLQCIEDEALAIAAFVRQLGDVCGHSGGPARAVDMRALLEAACERLRSAVPKNIRLSLEPAATDCAVCGDPNAVEQVVDLLVTNAYEAMPEGGEIGLRLDRRVGTQGAEALPPQEWVALSVSDTGRGMEAEVLERAFEPFFTTKEPTRAGLGLSRAYGIASRYGGHLEAQSAPGRGTTVVLYLPVFRPGEQVAAPDHALRPRGNLGAANGAIRIGPAHLFGTPAGPTASAPTSREGYLTMAAVDALVRALEQLCDTFEPGHGARVADLARALAERLGLDAEERERVWLGGLLHDVGKLMLSPELLRKPGALTPTEFEEVKRHPLHGGEILGAAEGLREITEMVLHHHERIDGNGYPDGLEGDDIPLAAQIIAIAEAYDSMCSNATYRAELPREQALEELLGGIGTFFDERLVRRFAESLN